MIYRQPSLDEANREALADHLQTLPAGCGAPGIKGDDGRRAAAQAVATLCQQEHPGLLFPDRYLEWLYAGALQAAGQPAAATGLLRARGVSFAAPLLAAAESVAMPVLWSVCSDGTLRPGTGWTAAEASCWVLELNALAADGTSDLELFTRPKLKRLLAGIAPAWDASDGCGGLILRGTARRLHARRRRQAAGEPWRTWCAGILNALGTARGWAQRPRILWMPSPATRRN